MGVFDPLSGYRSSVSGSSFRRVGDRALGEKKWGMEVNDGVAGSSVAYVNRLLGTRASAFLRAEHTRPAVLAAAKPRYAVRYAANCTAWSESLQRCGNARRVIFDSDADCLVYLNLLRQYSILYGCSLMGYCLMSNHVHLIVVPDRVDSLALLLRDVHGRYATYLNSRQSASGHVWQGRYYSCPLGPAASLDSTSLRGAQPGARLHGGAAEGLQMVEQCSALWPHG